MVRKVLFFLLLPILLILFGFEPKFLTDKAVTKTSSEINKEATSGVAVAVPSEEKEKLFKVVRVIDGDTFEIEGGEKVRLIGIDAPESIECFAIKSTDKLKELILNKLVRLEKDITDKDKYGRLLRYVYVEGIFVNELLVTEGFASTYSFPPDVKYQNKFLVAQQKAKEGFVGLWLECKSKKEVIRKVTKKTVVKKETPVSSSPVVSQPSVPAVSGSSISEQSSSLTSSQSPSVSSSTQSQSQTQSESHVYYTSSSSRSKYYYCDSDSGWKSLSPKNLRSFNSIEDLLKEFPTRKPHKEPVC